MGAIVLIVRRDMERPPARARGWLLAQAWSSQRRRKLWPFLRPATACDSQRLRFHGESSVGLRESCRGRFYVVCSACSLSAFAAAMELYLSLTAIECSLCLHVVGRRTVILNGHPAPLSALAIELWRIRVHAAQTETVRLYYFIIERVLGGTGPRARSVRLVPRGARGRSSS